MFNHQKLDGMIGVFDSGVGGLSVLRAIRQKMPFQPLLYFADQAHVPYGPRSLEEVRIFSEGVARFLMAQGACLIVVACNTASAAALYDLRQKFIDFPFVGMEPAVKPAAEQSATKKVGVLATPATFQGALYASVVERFAQDVVLYQSTCPGLVQQIEMGDLEGSRTRAILEEALNPMLKQGIDTVVLGCTHFPFVIPLIQKIAGPAVRVIDPAPAVARQVERVLETKGWLLAKNQAEGRFFTSGDAQKFQNILPCLLGETLPVSSVSWSNGQIYENN